MTRQFRLWILEGRTFEIDAGETYIAPASAKLDGRRLSRTIRLVRSELCKPGNNREALWV